MTKNKKIINVILTIFIIILFFVPSSANNRNNEIDLEDVYKICLTPGKNETMINFSWYSKILDKDITFAIWEKNKEKEFYDVESKKIYNGLVSNKVTALNLSENTTYFYSYKIDGVWSNPVKFKTKNFNDYSFVFMADPQIGASCKKDKSREENIKKDAWSWNDSIKKVHKNNKDLSFIICGGDVTNTKENNNSQRRYFSDMEYAGFLYPKYLRNIPIASAIGNHDENNTNFYNHFNMPNSMNLGKTVAGSDYYFKYGDSLFLFLNTNNLNLNEHDKFLKKVISENKDVKWKIVVFHHDIYGGGIHKLDEDVKLLRNYLPNILEKNKIDLVLCGHDHIYSRTYQLKNNNIIKKSQNLKDDNTEILRKEDGITYITGSSSTGSKFYKKINNDEKYIKKMYNKEKPTYTHINIKENSINIKTYELEEDSLIDKKIIIQK